MSDATDERQARLSEIALIASKPEGHGWLRQAEWQRLLDVERRRKEEALLEVQALIPDRHDPDYDRDVLSLERAFDSIAAVVGAALAQQPADQPACAKCADTGWKKEAVRANDGHGGWTEVGHLCECQTNDQPALGASLDAVYLIRTENGLLRPNARGYTNNPAEAGRYTHEEAKRYTRGLGPEKQARIIHEDDLTSADKPKCCQATEAHTRAAADVVQERRRQVISEGYDESHDDRHVNQSLAMAAACYAAPAWIYTIQQSGKNVSVQEAWPWPNGQDRRGVRHQRREVPLGNNCTRIEHGPPPEIRRQELVKAGALILAEIERLDRNLRGDT